jgi:hypothetical protein
MIRTDHVPEAVMPRHFFREAQSCLLDLAFVIALVVFAWLDPETYAKVFLHVEVAILVVGFFVLVIALRILYGQRRARRAGPRESAVVIPIRN